MFELNDVYQYDCLEAMKQIPDDSIDLIASDPPYGISLMSKKWDSGVPGVEIWKECLRILKPGAFLFAFASYRQDVYAQMIMNLRDAGFKLDHSGLYWVYASGFPKGTNAGKAAMKKLNDKGKVVGREKIDIGIQGGSMHSCRSSNVVEREKIVPTNPKAIALESAYVGFQPKPALENIIVAMKPIKFNSLIEQALDNKKGIMWVESKTNWSVLDYNEIINLRQVLNVNAKK